MTSSMRRRILMTITGIFICGLSVGLFSYSSFGMDPFQVFAHGTGALTPLKFGYYYSVLSLFMFLFILVIDRSMIGLGTVLNIFFIGHLADFSDNFLRTLFPSPSVFFRLMVLFTGILFMCLSSSLYFTAGLGVSVYDAIALIIHKKHPERPYGPVRICCDLVCVIIGVLAGAKAGAGTIITAFFMGPFISFFNRTISIPIRFGRQS